MKSSICVKRQSFEVRLNSVISFVFAAFCQPRILRYSARNVIDFLRLNCLCLILRQSKPKQIVDVVSLFHEAKLYCPASQKKIFGQSKPFIRIFVFWAKDHE